MFVYDNRLFCMRDIESLYTPAHTRIQTLAYHVYKQDQICIRNLQCLYTRTQTRRQTLLFDVDKQRQICIRALLKRVDALANDRIQTH